MQVSGGQGGGEVKKSEEIPSWCLGTNSRQGEGREGEQGLASTSPEKGAPSRPHIPAHCPAPLTRGPGLPGRPWPLAGESQRVAAHSGAHPHAPPGTPPRTRPLPPPRRPGWSPAPRVRASATQTGPGSPPRPRPRPPPPPGRVLTPRSRRDSGAAG